MKRHLFLVIASFAATACADSSGSDSSSKPASDPDLAVLSVGKADRVTTYWTDIRGELTVGGHISETIDYPSYYFGRTAVLHAGQKIQVDLSSNRKSLVRLYGPSTGTADGQPTFGYAMTKADTKKVGNKQVSSFTFDVTADGTYMLVYGPSNVWKADYTIDATCVGGCVAADACADDSECGAGQFCGDNGVRCIRAPCDANYNVCKAKLGAGGLCTGDTQCGDGFACREGTCQAQACAGDDDCTDGFCACGNSTCTANICKDFAKEGESCGGFRMANLVHRCSGDFSCVSPANIVADIPGHCGELTTVAEVLADTAKFDGKFIALQGVADPVGAMCTQMACSPANQCCNACGASMRMFDDASQIAGGNGIYMAEDGAGLGCSGNSCTWRDHCGLTPGNYWVAGWFHLESGITPQLDVVAKYGF